MGKTYSITANFREICGIFFGFFLWIFLLHGCAGTGEPKLKVVVYSFNFEGKAYRILSASSGAKEDRYNQLVGKDFVAVDFAQDRIIDKVIVGNVSRHEAQKVYDYGLAMAIQENRLRERLPVSDRFIEETPDFNYEIISFQVEETHPYNQFKITGKNRMYLQIVAVDREADGTLDEVLKGTATLEELQPQYSFAIKSGIQKGELIQVDSRIIVKKRIPVFDP